VCFTWCVQAPGHGKEEVDGLVGTEKTYADSVFARPGRLAEDDGDDYKAQRKILKVFPFGTMYPFGTITNLTPTLFFTLLK
jgi:hypothetical protein